MHRDWIDPHALDIIATLQRKGFTTFVVGGCVRDLLLGREPKDFDIGTSATPSDVRRAVPNAFIIGKRFRLVLVKRDQKQFEVATFRRETPAASDENTITGDNFFGTPQEDAQRRDFTVNGMFYDPIRGELIDYNHGLEDLKAAIIRMIGDPRVRLDEDPIRILRALRLAHMVGFSLDYELRTAMQERAHRLPQTALPRRREEFLKLLRLKDPAQAFLEAFDLGILQQISPTLSSIFENPAKVKEFTTYLRDLDVWALQPSEPLELFGTVVLAYIRTEVYPDDDVELHNKDFSTHKALNQLMRDELGMFKTEQSLALRAITMQSTLARVDEFQRRGERRRMALLKNDAFGLCYMFARRDYCLSAQDLKYWEEEYRRLLPRLQKK